MQNLKKNWKSFPNCFLKYLFLNFFYFHFFFLNQKKNFFSVRPKHWVDSGLVSQTLSSKCWKPFLGFYQENVGQSLVDTCSRGSKGQVDHCLEGQSHGILLARAVLIAWGVVSVPMGDTPPTGSFMWLKDKMCFLIYLKYTRKRSENSYLNGKVFHLLDWN